MTVLFYKIYVNTKIMNCIFEIYDILNNITNFLSFKDCNNLISSSKKLLLLYDNDMFWYCYIKYHFKYNNTYDTRLIVHTELIVNNEPILFLLSVDDNMLKILNTVNGIDNSIIVCNKHIAYIISGEFISNVLFLLRKYKKLDMLKFKCGVVFV